MYCVCWVVDIAPKNQLVAVFTDAYLLPLQNA